MNSVDSQKPQTGSANGVSLITPTRDRPDAFALCERWMGRQSYNGPLQWIVADDGEAAVVCRRGQEHLRLPTATDSRSSFRNNLLAAIERVRFDKILFIEDDDWYAPTYIEMMFSALDRWEIVGETNARYYHVRFRKYLIHSNTFHASLCQTGIRATLLPTVKAILTESRFPERLDGSLWKRSGLTDGCKGLLQPTTLTVGMKGLPGRAGLGIDHHQQELVRRYSADPEGRQLRDWIGDDAEFYGNPPAS